MGGGGGGGGGSLEDVLPCKTVLTVNAKTCLSPRALGILVHAPVGTLQGDAGARCC